MRECVIIDGLRTANARAHKDKGWFRNKTPDELLTAVYDALFARNPQVKPEDVEAVFVGSAAQVGMQNDIGRTSWLAGGFPESVPTNTICQQCPSGMAAIEHAARAIMCGEGDIYIAAGVEDMYHVPMGYAMEFPPRMLQRYKRSDIPMGVTAEKVAELWNISKEDMMQMAYYSHKNAAAARDSGKFSREIVPVEGEKEDGTKFMVDRDQWIRDNISIEAMAAMKSPFKENGVISAALSSPLTAGACALILMERQKADELGLDYHLKYKAGAMAGCDPTVMGIGPIYAVRKIFERTGLTADDIDVVEINEAFASQSLACLRDLGLEQNAPFKKTNLWGGALALGHPLGESGARIVITLNNIMKYEKPDAKYGLATLCGGFGNANASLWERVEK
ncbi:thiolase family protein [Desulfallas thermosapovorans]|uniref:acetyl-CoA C-acyltransferase n=1 Tax=Desulfallas thermosapovorans DSM 6562 TaxID=1121431 RepID=A0A5S4ZVS1_9FIRM|nr:thiolase family protein [Desulfallas thermosapovorans]TYO96178.1 acetyl-CoA acyltransferase [Desulfallas thermosapovorans DSM 6562]